MQYACTSGIKKRDKLNGKNCSKTCRDGNLALTGICVYFCVLKNILKGNSLWVNVLMIFLYSGETSVLVEASEHSTTGT